MWNHQNWFKCDRSARILRTNWFLTFERVWKNSFDQLDGGELIRFIFSLSWRVHQLLWTSLHGYTYRIWALTWFEINVWQLFFCLEKCHHFCNWSAASQLNGSMLNAEKMRHSLKILWLCNVSSSVYNIEIHTCEMTLSPVPGAVSHTWHSWLSLSCAG